ncbi:MAG TPA: TetR/AcrR family transcriptional regulator [Mycobacterium sp.]|jgi:AcrR family transcriptional regulator|nr:TetR/AcrR family transcriptional regulator [Mycobacterium sp.]
MSDTSRRKRTRNPARFDRSLDGAILSAVLEGLAERGYDRMSMDDVATRARVGKAAIYRRWPSKAVVVADAIAHWRRGLGSVQPPNTGSLRGDIDALAVAVPDLNEAEVGTMKVVIGVATAATHDPVLAAALDELVLSQPRRMIGVVLDNAVARGEIPAGRDLALIGDAALGLNILRAITGRPIDRVFIRRVLEDLILPLATAPADR